MPKYISQVTCVDHPELEGLRWTSNRRCIKCDAERVKARVRAARAEAASRPKEDRPPKVRDNSKAIRKRKERYAADPVFREKERQRCREANRRRRATEAEASVPQLDSYSTSAV